MGFLKDMDDILSSVTGPVAGVMKGVSDAAMRELELDEVECPQCRQFYKRKLDECPYCSYRNKEVK